MMMMMITAMMQPCSIPLLTSVVCIAKYGDSAHVFSFQGVHLSEKPGNVGEFDSHKEIDQIQVITEPNHYLQKTCDIN